MRRLAMSVVVPHWHEDSVGYSCLEDHRPTIRVSSVQQSAYLASIS